MPVSRKTEPEKPKSEDDYLCAMLRILLKEARGNYTIWGRMLQGPTPIERLLPGDLSGLMDIVRRWQTDRNRGQTTNVHNAHSPE